MTTPDPTTHLTLRELHDELGKLLASHLMPDTLTNVTGVALKGDGIQRVTLDGPEDDKLHKKQKRFVDIQHDLDKANDMVHMQNYQIADLKAKLLACQQGP